MVLNNQENKGSHTPGMENNNVFHDFCSSLFCILTGFDTHLLLKIEWINQIIFHMSKLYFLESCHSLCQLWLNTTLIMGGSHKNFEDPMLSGWDKSKSKSCGRRFRCLTLYCHKGLTDVFPILEYFRATKFINQIGWF